MEPDPTVEPAPTVEPDLQASSDVSLGITYTIMKCNQKIVAEMETFEMSPVDEEERESLHSSSSARLGAAE